MASGSYRAIVKAHDKAAKRHVPAIHESVVGPAHVSRELGLASSPRRHKQHSLDELLAQLRFEGLAAIHAAHAKQEAKEQAAQLARHQRQQQQQQQQSKTKTGRQKQKQQQQQQGKSKLTAAQEARLLRDALGKIVPETDSDAGQASLHGSSAFLSKTQRAPLATATLTPGPGHYQSHLERLSRRASASVLPLPKAARWVQRKAGDTDGLSQQAQRWPEAPTQPGHPAHDGSQPFQSKVPRDAPLGGHIAVKKLSSLTYNIDRSLAYLDAGRPSCRISQVGLDSAAHARRHNVARFNVTPAATQYSPSKAVCKPEPRLGLAWRTAPGRTSKSGNREGSGSPPSPPATTSSHAKSRSSRSAASPQASSSTSDAAAAVAGMTWTAAGTRVQWHTQHDAEQRRQRAIRAKKQGQLKSKPASSKPSRRRPRSALASSLRSKASVAKSWQDIAQGPALAWSST